MLISYCVNRKKYSLNMDISYVDTPRSIYIACLKDYSTKQSGSVHLPYYDDDNDVFYQSNIPLNVMVTSGLCAALRESDPFMAAYSNNEIKSMF